MSVSTDASNSEARFDAILAALEDLKLDEDTAFKVAERMERFVVQAERYAAENAVSAERELEMITGRRI
jgi:hypothetical protein